MRLIDADKLTELCDIMADKCVAENGDSIWHQFRATVEWSPTVKTVPVKHARWIPCNERLPEVGIEVLISTKGSIYVGALELDVIEGHTCWYETLEYRRIIGVTAWMPLPEPYKGEGGT